MKCRKSPLRIRNDMGWFRKMVRKDNKKVFLDFEMFGETHRVGGKDMVVIVDESELVERKKLEKDLDHGLYESELLFYASAEETGELPPVGRVMDFDGKKYRVTGAVDEDGIYSISLGTEAAWR